MQTDQEQGVQLDPTTPAQVVETVGSTTEPVPSDQIPAGVEPVVAPDPTKGDFGPNLVTDEGERLDMQVEDEPAPKPNPRDFGL